MISEPWRPRVFGLLASVTAALSLALAGVASASGWTVEPVPGTGLAVAVSCPSARSCIAVGYATVNVQRDSFGTRAWRWDGTRWLAQPIPNPRGLSRLRPSDEPQGVTLGAVSCTSATACTAVGSFLDANAANPKSPESPGHGATVAERWNGRRWSIQPTPNGPGAPRSALSGVSCISPRACVAVGYFTNSAGDQARTLTERWDGRRWSIQPSPNPAGAIWSQLNDVSCWSPAACIAVGKRGSGAPLIERWNGRRWSIQQSRSPSSGAGGLVGVSCTSATACVAVGSTGADVDTSGTEFDTGTLAERWNGRRWSIQRAPTAPGAQDSALQSVSCASGNACTAVGSWVLVGEQPSRGGGTLADRWDGVRWSVQDSATPQGAAGSGLLGVSCRSRTACTAVGAFMDSAGNLAPFAERYL